MCTTTPSSRLTLPAELASGRLARRFIDEHWCASHDSAKQDHVLVLITELVSNAVRYGGPPITMSIDCVGARGVKLSVSDGSEKLPTSRDVAPNADGGRGVQLVDLLSSEW
ncbi:MAG: ATP-binding protein, partial [Janthinobacterium lividum]